MASYKAPLREIDFVLNRVLDTSQLTALPGYADATPETIDGLVGEAAKLFEQQLAPLNAGADAGCVYKEGKVTVPPGFKDFYTLYWQSGWVGISTPTEYGGQGLPYLVSKVVEEMECSASVAFALYPGLTIGCYEAIEASGNAQQKKDYLHKLGTGEWAGTMCMTESQAGSDVGAAKTRAIPQADGSVLIEGAKIFISSGEHEMTDNIIHFVLARLPDSPPGVKGLSTFVVPKYLLKPDGTPGERNKLHATAIEHKMGLHGSCTCSLSFEGAKGWMVGAPNQGIQNMFVMMNMERIMVGFQGLGLCEFATQNAIRYAQDRKQGKSPDGDTIIGHADVRRMLLTMKATTEGARVMAYETALNLDLARRHPDAAVREIAQDWVDLTTPLVKAFCTDSAVDLGSLAVQVYGGHGYIREHGVEQALRDAKILCLYEGTNGIQAMDLVRRKLMLHNGRLPQRFFKRVREELARKAAGAEFLEAPLARALADLEATAAWLQQSFKAHPDDAGFGAVDFQRAFALTLLGYNWLRMARLAPGHPDAGFAAGKRATAEFFAQRMLPQVSMLCGTVRQSAKSQMELAAANF